MDTDVRTQRLLLGLAVLLAAALVGLAWFRYTTVPSAEAPAAVPPSGHDFVLTSAAGPLDTRSLRGRVVLVFFGYTYCPDICPTALTAVSQALGELSADEAAQVRAVFVSVDPERDTPARLQEYTAFFHPAIVGVTGRPEEIATAARDYGAIYMRQDVGSSSGYVVDHSAWLYVLAPDGRLVGRLTHGISGGQIAAEIRKWLPGAPSQTPPTKGSP